MVDFEDLGQDAVAQVRAVPNQGPEPMPGAASVEASAVAKDGANRYAVLGADVGE